jgi:IS5 family transposase
MHQTCKGRQWHFGKKGHIGVDKDTAGLIHSVEAFGANVHDLTPQQTYCTARSRRVVYMDAGYQGIEKTRGDGGQGSQVPCRHAPLQAPSLTGYA